MRPPSTQTIDRPEVSATAPELIPRLQRKDVRMSTLTRCIRDERGATAIEYGLIAGLIAVVIIVAVGLVGADVLAIFTALAAAL